MEAPDGGKYLTGWVYTVYPGLFNTRDQTLHIQGLLEPQPVEPSSFRLQGGGLMWEWLD